MKSAYLEELEIMKKRLLVSMEDYMTGNKFDNACDVSYSAADISECSRILAVYVGCLDHLGSDAAEDEIMDCVKNAVLQLNQLSNDRPDLLTPERESICDYMEFAAKGAGLKDIERDITEEWREW
jgi:hypothetical protein